MKKVDAAFAGFIIAAGIGLFCLPFCVFANLPPAAWGSVAIGIMPLGAAIGLALHWAMAGADDGDEPAECIAQRSPRPAISYDPSRWTGRQ